MYVMTTTFTGDIRGSRLRVPQFSTAPMVSKEGGRGRWHHRVQCIFWQWMRMLAPIAIVVWKVVNAVRFTRNVAEDDEAAAAARRHCHPPETWDGVTTAIHLRTRQTVGEVRTLSSSSPNWGRWVGFVRITGWMRDVSGVMDEDEDPPNAAMIYEHSADHGTQVVVSSDPVPKWPPMTMMGVGVGGDGGAGINQKQKVALQRVLYASVRPIEQEATGGVDVTRFVNERLWSICGGKTPGVPMNALVASIEARGLARVPPTALLELTVLHEDLSESRFRSGDVVVWPRSYVDRRLMARTPFLARPPNP